MPPIPSETQWPVYRRAARTVVVVDVVESVRLMEQNEEDTVHRWQAFVGEVVTHLLPQHGGRLVKSLGDGLMLEFEAVPPAIQCAFAMQDALSQVNIGREERDLMSLRMGAHVADLFVDERDIYGAGVNLAARLTMLADPDGIVVSDSVRDQLVPGLDAEVESMGLCWLKHFSEPVNAFRLRQTARQVPTRVPAQREPQGMRLSIAVIPFSARQPGCSDAMLGEVLADDLTTVLSAIPELQVISRMSSSAVAGRTIGSDEIGKLLRADYVLAGTYHTVGDTMVVHAELTFTPESSVVGAWRLSALVGSLVADQSPIVDELVEHLTSALISRQVDESRRSALPNLAGHTLLLGGISLMHRFSRRDFERARELLLHLQDRWPRSVAPHAWLARWYWFSVMQGWSGAPEQDRLAALQSASRALDLDSQSSVALAISGSIQIGLNKDIDKGLALYRAALESNPSDSLAWLLKGTAHAFKGDGVPAIEASEQASRLSPLDPMRFLYECHAGGAALAAGDYERARNRALISMRANAGHLSTYRVLAIAQSLLGEMDDARATVHGLLKLDPHHSVEGFLASAPSAAFEIGQRCAQALARAGLPQRAH